MLRVGSLHILHRQAILPLGFWISGERVGMIRCQFREMDNLPGFAATFHQVFGNGRRLPILACRVYLLQDLGCASMKSRPPHG